MNRLTRSKLNSLRRSSSKQSSGGGVLLKAGAVGALAAVAYKRDDIQEQLFGAGPNVDRRENIKAWREKQAKLAADREAAVVEVSAADEAEEAVETVADVAPVEEVAPEAISEVEEVVEEVVVEETANVAEVAEVVNERPDRDFDAFVEDDVEVKLPEVEAAPEAEADVEVSVTTCEPVFDVAEDVADPVVAEEALPVETVATEEEEAVTCEQETESPATSEDVVLIDTEVQIGQASRIAAQTTDELIAAIERSATAIIEYVRAKRYAFSFVGDTSRRVAIWLQVNEYYNEMERCVDECSVAQTASNDALGQMESLLGSIEADIGFGLDQELSSMRQRIVEQQELSSKAQGTLEKLREIEENAEAALAEHKQTLSEMLGDSDATEDELWRTLNPKFSQNDLKGLIFLAQKKIQNYKCELHTLSENYEQMKDEALKDQENRLNQETQQRIEQLEAEYHERINQKRDEINESLREEYELDLALQLKRQAAAHSMHLSDELSECETHLTREFNQRIERELNSLVDKYNAQIEKERTEVNNQMRDLEDVTMKASAHLKGQMDGIHQTLEERLKTESQIKTLQTLLVGVDSLNNAVLGDDTVPLAAMIGDLKRITAESAFLNPILDSLPSKAVDSGVVSSGSLRTTFGGLKQLAYDNHLCNEDQHGFLMSTLSLVYSKLGYGSELSALSHLVTQAESFMAQDDFEGAVRLLNQTRGEPRRIFGTWMDEARTYLEVRQAMDALKALGEARILSSRSLS